MGGLLGDFRFALRSMRKTPGFAIAAVLILALGIGANTAIFSIVDGVLLRPLPYEQPDDLVQLWHTPPQKQFPGTKTFSLSAANYLDWEQRNDVFAKSAVYAFTHFRLTGSGEPQEIQAARVEPTYFDVLRGHVAAGRAITENDGQPGNAQVAVLSHKLWQAQFAGDPAIVGKLIVLNGQSYAVIGVMASDFQKPGYAQLWTPLIWDPAEKVVRGEHHFSAVARLKPGASVTQAQSELDAISTTLAQQYPADDAGWGALVQPLREATVGPVRGPLMILLGAVAFVLLIACANVANLILAKTLDRRKEIAIRSALGAGRARIVRQMLAEAVAISLAGGAIGLIVAHFGIRLVVHFLGESLPRVNEIALDVPVLAFAFAVAVVTGIVSGLLPALHMSGADPQDALKQGGRSGSAGVNQRTRAALVIGEVALSLVLLAGAGLMIRTLWNLRDVNPGFEAQHVLTASIRVADGDYQTPAQEVAFIDEILRRVRALPGVQAAGLADSLPLQDGSTQPVAVAGQPDVDMSHQPEVSVRMITPGFMSGMHMAVVRGRDITDQDNATSAPVVLISEAMAKQFWPNEDPLGKRLTLTFFPDAVREVVGVVADIKERGLDHSDPVSALYWPLAQFKQPASMGQFRGFSLQLVLRTANAPASATSSVRSVLHEISPDTPVVDIRTLQDIVDESLSPQRFNMLLLAAFAALALLLAGVGIYSVLAYAVRQRTREIGMRMALGAQTRNVLGKVVADGMKPTLIGIGIGLAVAMALGTVMQSLVFGVRAIDAPTLVCVSLLLLAVGIVAGLLPAWRATQVSPLAVLRDE